MQTSPDLCVPLATQAGYWVRAIHDPAQWLCYVAREKWVRARAGFPGANCIGMSRQAEAESAGSVSEGVGGRGMTQD